MQAGLIASVTCLHTYLEGSDGNGEHTVEAFLLPEWNFTHVPGDLLVVFVMCCYCDLGKKNATAGLYFQRTFLNIN